MGSMNDSTEKLKVYRNVFEDLDVDGMSVQGMIELLEDVVKGNPTVDLHFVTDDSYSYSTFSIISSRLETDEEYNSRHEHVRLEAQRKEAQKEINSLSKKKVLTIEEKERLIQLIQENK